MHKFRVISNRNVISLSGDVSSYFYPRNTIDKTWISTYNTLVKYVLRRTYTRSRALLLYNPRANEFRIIHFLSKFEHVFAGVCADISLLHTYASTCTGKLQRLKGKPWSSREIKRAYAFNSPV